jgi:hypothetical protein
MRNVSDKSCREDQNTNFMISNLNNRAVYEIMRKNIVEWGGPQITIWRMHVACWVPKATNAHAEYLIFIAFPLQH